MVKAGRVLSTFLLFISWKKFWTWMQNSHICETLYKKAHCNWKTCFACIMWTTTMSLNRRNECLLHIIVRRAERYTHNSQFGLFPNPATSLGHKYPHFHTAKAITLDNNVKEMEKMLKWKRVHQEILKHCFCMSRANHLVPQLRQWVQLNDCYYNRSCKYQNNVDEPKNAGNV